MRADGLRVRRRRIPRKALVGTAAGLWLLFFLGRAYGHHGQGFVARALEFGSMHWMGSLFLIAAALFCADITTGFGFFFRTRKPQIRRWAFGTGLVLALIANIQGIRPPIVNEYELTIENLPPALDGALLAAVSDLHAGGTVSSSWLVARANQIMALKPDMVLLLGDLFEGHGETDPALAQALLQLSAPLGIYAVRGNHGRVRRDREDTTLALLSQAGIPLLSNEWVQPADGLIVAGIDDLTSSRRRPEEGEANLVQALNDRPAGATVYLSHTPWLAEQAADAGVDLMLSGHTHGGQIWPFGYLVKLRYPCLAGRYDIKGMQLIVSRGAGAWGPRMRLWSPGEILLIRLKSSKAEG